MWFQQDGAKCHTARVPMDLLRDEFGEHFISRSGPVNWLPRSYDLTPLDYFLWAMLKLTLIGRQQPKCWKEYAKLPVNICMK